MTRVLIVEDEPDTRHLLELMLNKAGYDVVTATNYDEAISEFEDCQCSIVLLDWMMPGQSGIEVAKKIQSMRYAYVVMVTAKDLSQAQESLDAGARDFIQKPFDQDELVECVKAAEAVVHARELLRKRLSRLQVDPDIVNQYL